MNNRWRKISKYSRAKSIALNDKGMTCEYCGNLMRKEIDMMDNTLMEQHLYCDYCEYSNEWFTGTTILSVGNHFEVGYSYNSPEKKCRKADNQFHKAIIEHRKTLKKQRTKAYNKKRK